MTIWLIETLVKYCPLLPSELYYSTIIDRNYLNGIVGINIGKNAESKLISKDYKHMTLHKKVYLI